MTSFELISTIVAIVALIVAVVALLFTAIQTRQALAALQLDQQRGISDTVLDFTHRYEEICKDGEPAGRIADRKWVYQFWSLLATEFYFFHHQAIPPFMFSLWMLDLAELYSGPEGHKVWASHNRYLDTYSHHYQDMCQFFERIYQAAQEYKDEEQRNAFISEFVTIWIKKNKKSKLD